MSTQDAPAFLTQKLAGFALLILGGLFAAYGINYSATAATVFGVVMVIGGVIVLAAKIMRRNQNQL